MLSVKEVIALSTDYLQRRAVPAARRQAEELLSYVLDCNRLDLYLDFERPVSEKELETLRHFLKRRGAREPLQYIFGQVDFFDCSLKVDRSALIPRGETELLVERVAARLSQKLEERGTLSGQVLWDLCTGSGCIAIALKKKFPSLTVIGSDLSPAALSLARENSSRNQVDVVWRQGDLFAPFKGEKADFIVSNPPYVSDLEYLQLEEEVRCFEPKLALVSGEKGIDHYKQIAASLLSFLNPGGVLCLELGKGQSSLLRPLFAAKECKIEIESDYAGIERFFFLENE